MSNETNKPEKKEQSKKGERTPGRKLTREDLANTSGGMAPPRLPVPGCCTQGCCGDDPK